MREIFYIKKACSISNKILTNCIRNLKKKKFRTELDVYNYLEERTKKNKCKLAFKPVVAMGANASEIHHKPDNTRLKKGFLVIDFGVKYKGFCSDMTRTVYIGKPSKKEKEIYDLVLEAQETALSYAIPGMHSADVDAIARASLWKYYKNFMHGTGHGVGRRIHQAPSLHPRGNRILRKGHAITIEPGLYFEKQLGVRIEDTILVKEEPEILTNMTKRLIEIR